jgi:CubicO group peptidase (beta-lactamase class C family)
MVSRVPSPEGAFGHYGFGGSGAFADPRRDLAVGMIVNSGSGTPFADLRMAQIATAAIRCATDRSG